MEENRSMSEINRLKDYNKAIITNRKIVIDHRFREEIVSGQESCGDGGNLVDEFSWPPRSYTCSFCKKEFRSAQALGGHMNVHRREKAKLRQITPIRYLPFLHPQSQHFSSNSKFLDLNPNLNLDPNPNPSPNLNPNITCFASNTSSIQTMLPPFTYSSMSPPLIHRLCHPNYESSNTFRSRKSDIVVDGFDVFSHEKESMDVKKSANGLLVESKFDDLDLELRLGCS